MKKLTYNSLSNIEKKEFFSFLKTTKNYVSPAAVNMWDDNWKIKKETLPYLLENTNRFDGINGEFYIFYDNTTLIACGGVYISSFNNCIGIAGVRTWVDTKYRHSSILRESMLPVHKQWCVDRDIKIVSLTFNQYNKNLIQVFKRNRLGETFHRTTTRQEHHLFFNGLHEVPFLVNVQFTPQWLIYEKLDKNFYFNWNTIKW